MNIKKWQLPLILFGLTVSCCADAANQKYQYYVAKMACGNAHYTLTSLCAKSVDPFELNNCKPQSLLIENGDFERHTLLPELPIFEKKRIKASGGNLKALFVVAWACTNDSNGPIATLRYSTGGGTAEHAESWTHYDKAGKLIESQKKLTPDQVNSIESSFKKIPSIMPD